MDVRKMEVKQSALSSLKSELIRKKEECLLLKRNFSNIPKKKLKPLENADVSSDATSVSSLDRDPDEEELLRKSRKCLENKARLYNEKVKSSGRNNEEIDSESLVNFSQKNAEDERRKVAEEPSDVNNKTDAVDRHYTQIDNSDWVEYVDFLGRTRKCLKEDLEYMRKLDDEFMKKVSKESDLVDNMTQAASTDTSNQRSEFLQRLHEDWERQEQQLKDKEDIHYQDVFFDEARAHGVGYYAFSTDEKARAAQQEALQRLRQETKKLQQEAKQKAINTLTQSSARVEAAKERMLKLLQSAIVGGDADSSTADTERVTAILAPVQAAMEATQKNVLARRMEQLESLTKEDETETVSSDSAEINNSEEKDDVKRKYHIRPWDEGKEGVASQQYVGYVKAQNREVMSQEQWIAKKREERPAEFAPLQEPDRDGVDMMEYSLPPKSKNSLFFASKKQVSYEATPRAKLVNRFQESSGCEDLNSDCIETVYNSDPNETVSPAVSSSPKLVNRVQQSFAHEDVNSDSNYTDLSSQTAVGWSDPYAGMTPDEISQAVEAGLKYLRQKAEERSAKSERGLINIV